MNTGTAQTIDTGDHVRHSPTGETWVVAYVANELLCACGWPCTLVPVNECTLVKKATPEGRFKLLHELAAMNADDSRKSYAARVLAAPVTTPAAPLNDELLVACITLDGTTLTIEARSLSDMFGTDDEQHTYELKFKRMTRTAYEALGEFNGF